MTDDKYDQIGKVLEFYKIVQKEVHIRIISGSEQGSFRNGYILDVDVDKRTFLIVDRVLGNKNYSFYEIDENIQPFKEAKK